jgi:hypothetical protein
MSLFLREEHTEIFIAEKSWPMKLTLKWDLVKIRMCIRMYFTCIYKEKIFTDG